MGKKIQETTPYATTYIRHKYDSTKPNSLYSVTSYGINTPLSKVYYDKFARVVHSYKEDMNKNKISTSKTYNAKGELKTQILPDGKIVKYTYDNYGRQTRVNRPDPAGSGTIDDYISYNGLITTQTTDNIQKVTEKNALGKVIKVTDGANSTDADEKSTITYSYYPDGNLKSTKDSKNNTITMEYDTLGYKSKMIDPDMGTWTYTNDAIGRVKNIRDANLKDTYLVYDSIGRLTAKHEGLNSSLWHYDRTKKGFLSVEEYKSNSTTLYKKDYHYKNSTTQLIKTTEQFDDKTYSTQMNYHTNGKLRDLTYPNGLTVRHNYYNGYLKSIQDGTNTDGKMVYEIKEIDHLGRVTKTLLENGITNSYGYNGSGLLSSEIGSDGIQKINLSYTYDSRGNVKTKTDAMIGYHNNAITGLTETYAYDNLNRIKDVQVDASELNNNDRLRFYHYDNLGNLTNKNGLSLNYNNTRPHALSSTSDGRSYTYDANGNMLSDTKRTITYNPSNKPISITANGQTTTFTYGNSQNRYKKTFGTNGMSKTHYVGKLFERTHPTNNNNYIDKNFIYFGGKLIKIKKKENYGITEPIKVTDSFIHQDNLGNVIAITDKTGKITNRRSYAPFGEIRHLLYKEAVEKGENLSTIDALKFSTTNRAFTGHESIECWHALHLTTSRIAT